DRHLAGAHAVEEVGRERDLVVGVQPRPLLERGQGRGAVERRASTVGAVVVAAVLEQKGREAGRARLGDTLPTLPNRWVVEVHAVLLEDPDHVLQLLPGLRRL